jgi:hypothetical protein
MKAWLAARIRDAACLLVRLADRVHRPGSPFPPAGVYEVTQTLYRPGVGSESSTALLRMEPMPDDPTGFGLRVVPDEGA